SCDPSNRLDLDRMEREEERSRTCGPVVSHQHRQNGKDDERVENVKRKVGEMKRLWIQLVRIIGSGRKPGERSDAGPNRIGNRNVKTLVRLLPELLHIRQC